MLILLGFIFFVKPVFATTPTTGILNDNSNIRDTAGYTKIITLLEKDTKVSIIEETADWYNISLKDGTKGWVIKWLVNPETAPKTTKQKTAALLYASKIRKTPEIKAGNIIEILYPGTTVQILDDKDKWYSIKYGSNKNGWIAKELVSTPSEAEITASASTTKTKLKIASTTLPNFVSVAEINKYWQEIVNAERKKKNLRQLVIDQRLITTATKWAGHLGQINKTTHARPDGESAHQWIKEEGLTFTKRYSEEGWKTNFFSENLGTRLNVKPTLNAVKSALDSVLESYLKEGPKGVHYKSVYYPDWNSFGAGFFPIKNKNGTYTMYFVFHYGSLVL